MWLVLDKKNRLVNVAPFVEGPPDKGAGDIAPADDKFTVRYHLASWNELVDAEKLSENDTEYKVRLFKYEAYVHHRYIDDTFYTVQLNIDANTYDSGTGKITAPASGVSFVNKAGNEKNEDRLPKRDTDGLLVFKLYYYAFGTPESGGVYGPLGMGCMARPTILTAWPSLMRMGIPPARAPLWGATSRSDSAKAPLRIYRVQLSAFLLGIRRLIVGAVRRAA
jgi:hypothetical protein